MRGGTEEVYSSFSIEHIGAKRRVGGQQRVNREESKWEVRLEVKDVAESKRKCRRRREVVVVEEIGRKKIG